MIKKILISFIIPLILLVAACSTTGGWIENPYAHYPEADYVCAVGRGYSQDEADLDARKELASVFGLAVNSTITRTVAETTDLETTDYSEYLLSTTQASVNVDNLYGVEIVKRLQAEDGSYRSLAVMEKSATRNRYASLIESDLDEIEAIKNGISHDGSFSTLGKASELVTLSDECNTRIVMYNYLSGENRALINLSESKEIYRQALRSIVLETEVAGDETGAVASAVNKIFTDAGFAVSNGELAPTAKAKVSINWTRTGGTGNPFIFANYNADVSVIDLKGNETVMVFSASDKEGHQIYESAQSRAVKRLIETLEEEFSVQLLKKYTL